jgi:ferredoxin
MSMLRSLARRGLLGDVVHVHCDRSHAGAVFTSELRALASENLGYVLHERFTSRDGRLTPGQIHALCPDWRTRETFACGPPALLRALAERWPCKLHVERFQPDEELVGDACGQGGAIAFCASALHAASDGSAPILLAGERAGATLPHGCRMGICHSCVGRLRSGRVRDLRTGRVHGQPGELVQTCVNAPEGAIEIEL